MADWGCARLQRKRFSRGGWGSRGKEEGEGGNLLRTYRYLYYPPEVNKWEADRDEYDVILASRFGDAER